MELAGGDANRGRALFASDRLKSSTCHRIRGEGQTIGPDLSNLAHRDLASVLRDIRDPDAMIHPDYVAWNLELQGGGSLTGFLRLRSPEAYTLLGADGKESVVDRAEVVELRPSPVSLMPTGLLDGLDEGQVRDLLTFLVKPEP